MNMKKINRKKILTILSIFSLGAIAIATIVPIVNSQLNSNNNVKTLSSNRFSWKYNGITNVPSSIDVSSKFPSMYPSEIFNSSEHINKLKNIIVNSVVNTVDGFGINDIELDQSGTIINNLNGTIQLSFNIIHFKAIVNDGNNFTPIQSKNFITELTGLLSATPSNIPSNNATIIVPSEFSSLTNVEAISRLQNEILPKIVGGTQISIFSIDIKSYRAIFPDKMFVSASFSNYFDDQGQLVSSSGTINFTIQGFTPLINSTFNDKIDASSLKATPDDINLDNTFMLIKENIFSVTREVKRSDIANFSSSPYYSENKAVISFDLINNLWIDNGIVETKHLEMTLENLESASFTSINAVISSNILENYTSSQLKATAANGDWTKNSTLKSIIADNLINTVDSPILNPNIEITSVQEKNSLGNGNYSQLFVSFDLINFSAKDSHGQAIEKMSLTTTIQGFKTKEGTTINSKILAKSSDSSTIGFKTFHDITVNNVTYDIAKEIISSNIQNPNGNVSPNDVEILSLNPNLSLSTVDVSFKLNNGKYLESNGDVVQQKELSTKIYGFKIYQGSTKFGLSNGMSLDARTAFVSTLNEPAITLATKKPTLIAIVKSFITGNIPDSLDVTITNTRPSGTTLSFDATIRNYYTDSGLDITNMKSFQNITINNLPTNSPKGTNIYPILPIKQQGDTTVVTIDDLRPKGPSYDVLKKHIISNVRNPISELKTSDIQIIDGDNNPTYSWIDNSVTVSFKIINSKYKDPASGLGADSPVLKVKFVGFNYIPSINKLNYTINQIPNEKIGDFYPSDFVNKYIDPINNEASLTKTEKILSLQNIISPFAEINLSNLNLENSTLRFLPNNQLGTLQVDLYSYNFYDQNGVYQQIDTNIASFALQGFAKTLSASATVINWPSDGTLNYFAPEISLKNINNIITFQNLPVGVVPQFSFKATDVVVINGQEQDYGSIDIKVTLSSYFDVNGRLMNETKETTKTFKTMPYFSTKIRIENNTILNEKYKGIVASEATNLDIQQIIGNKVDGVPTDFSPEKDISIIEKKPNDNDGELIVSFTISNYYKNGTIQKTPLTFNNVKIYGFYKVAETKKDNDFYKQTWFILLVSVTAGSLLLLLIVFLFYIAKRKNKEYY